MQKADSVIVLDFETTGLSPDIGDRGIEIGAVRIENGEITERFQELMNPGFRISSYIEDYTGIKNSMLANAAPCSEVMRRFAVFLGESNIVAHNASFDQRFLEAEFSRLAHPYKGTFTCSLLAARRIYPLAPNHKLGTLVDYINLPSSGGFHRALYDSEMTAKVWLHMLKTLHQKYSLDSVPLSYIQKLNKTPKKSVPAFLTRLSHKPH